MNWIEEFWRLNEQNIQDSIPDVYLNYQFFDSEVESVIQDLIHEFDFDHPNRNANSIYSILKDYIRA